MQPIDVTGLRVDAHITVSAEPDLVWDLLAEITNAGRWSPECVHTAWLGDRADPRPGVRFSGHNRAGNGFERTVTCVITEADRPRTFAWIVLDDTVDAGADDHPSASWRYELEPAPHGGTLVRECFVHDSGDSGLRWMMRENPDRQAEIIERRLGRLHSNMLHALAAMKTEAEARVGAPGPGSGPGPGAAR